MKQDKNLNRAVTLDEIRDKERKGLVIDATFHEDDDTEVTNPVLQTLTLTSFGKDQMKKHQKNSFKVMKSNVSSSLKETIQVILDCVSNGEFGKAMTNFTKDIKAFVKSYSELDDNDCNDIAKNIIMIGKSFYEYDPMSRTFIDDHDYDQLVAAYIRKGNVEPAGIIPNYADGKSIRKAKIHYPSLHNNMDKAYILADGDPIPNGVKEKDSVESYLHRVYTTLEISSEVRLSLEFSPKIDGVSVNGTVDQDRLINPQTRGDEEESMSIIGLNRMILPIKTDVESFGIQFEAFVTEENRKASSEYLKLSTPYASCRHAASGLIHRLCATRDPELVKFLSFYPIESDGLEGIYTERMDYLSNFKMVPSDMPSRITVTGNMEELIAKAQEYFQYFEEIRPKLSFAIDGMVITVVNDEYQKAIGRVGRTNQYQIAWKFDPETAIAKVAGVDLDRGRKGFRTVQIRLDEPVYLGGARYDHVPMLSYDIYEKMKLKLGTTIRIHRVGDVIPSITVEKDCGTMDLEVPKFCPDCGKPLTIKNKKLYCGNINCDGNVVGRFCNFVEVLGIEDYNDSFMEAIQDKFKLLNISGLINLSNDQLTNKGFNTKRALAFTDAVKESLSSHRDYEILTSLGIPEIGISRAKDFLKEIPIGDLADATSTEINRAVHAVPGISAIDEVVEFICNKTFRNDLKAVLPYIKNITKSFTTTMRIGHTGGAVSAQVKEICDEYGFEIVDGKSFDVLITSSKDHVSKKTEKAKKSDLPVYTNDEFVQRYSLITLKRRA